MTADEIAMQLSRVDRSQYPELSGYSSDEIYDGNIGPGALYLAARMARSISLMPGDVVMDLGCGRGATSAFLARRFDVRVVAVDLRISATELYGLTQDRGIRDHVFPLNLDITQKLPFADDYFDAIFCMESIYYYGGNVGFIAHLLKHLNPGGWFCIGSPCFNREFMARELSHLPKEYDDGTDLWMCEFSKMHSPSWWAALLEDSGLVCIEECTELQDGVIMWEDELRYNIEHRGWSQELASTNFSQIAYGYDHEPYLTHFVLIATKKEGAKPGAPVSVQ